MTAKREPVVRRRLELAVAVLAAAAVTVLYFFGPKEGWLHTTILWLVGIGLVGILIAELLEPFIWLVGLTRGKRPIESAKRDKH